MLCANLETRQLLNRVSLHLAGEIGLKLEKRYPNGYSFILDHIAHNHVVYMVNDVQERYNYRTKREFVNLYEFLCLRHNRPARYKFAVRLFEQFESSYIRGLNLELQSIDQGNGVPNNKRELSSEDLSLIEEMKESEFLVNGRFHMIGFSRKDSSFLYQYRKAILEDRLVIDVPRFSRLKKLYFRYKGRWDKWPHKRAEDWQKLKDLEKSLEDNEKAFHRAQSILKQKISNLKESIETL